ncbi:hypothetical protein Btru_004118 [Bulinus truncatus]|nr:hypothetical protein Btru_004118 [Bulinus truncatus]
MGMKENTFIQFELFVVIFFLSYLNVNHPIFFYERPISGIITNLLSVRYAVYLGAILMAVGMLCVSFTYSLPLMMFFYSIVTGVGFGICYSPLIIVISFYFEKHRILANGILFCAPGTAVFSLPYLVSYLIANNGWRYTFALIGSIILHVLIFASVFFPTESEKSRMINTSLLGLWKSLCKKWKKSDQEKSMEHICSADCDELNSISGNGVCQDHPLLDYTISPNNLLLTSPTSTVSTTSLTPSMTGPALRGLSSPLDSTESSVGDINERRVSSVSNISSQLLQYYQNPHIFGELSKEGNLATGSMVLVSSIMGSSIIIPVKMEDAPADPEKETFGVISSLRRVFKSKALWFLNFNAMFFMSGSGVHDIHFPSFAESKGMSRLQVSEFYMVYGVVMVCGRLFGGLVFNRLKSHLMLLLFILQLLNGIVLGLSPLYANTVGGIFAMKAGIALVYGQSYILFTPLLTQLLSINDLPIAFGVNQLFIGIGYTIAPILAGFLYDATQTFDIPMMMGGSCTAFGALLIIPLLFYQRTVCKNGASKRWESTEDNVVREWKIEKDQTFKD